MRTTLVFLAFFFTILAIGYGLIDRSDRDVPLAIIDRQYASDSVQPAQDSDTSFHTDHDAVLKGYQPHSTMTPEMPRSNCTSVGIVDNKAAKFAHEHQIFAFINASGFGPVRMEHITNARGIETGAKEIDRAELVSLLKEKQPAAYVLDTIATPRLMKVARRRSLDGFEERSLQAVRKGADLVWSPEAPNRMFGALRAQSLCLECHTHAREGDLLGAFTYFLTKPVGEMEKW